MANFVDMDSKTCIFGHGAIKISIFGQKVLFEEITPVGAGTEILKQHTPPVLNQTSPTTVKIGEWESTGNKLHVIFDSVFEVTEFCANLDDIEKSQGGIFIFKGIIFITAADRNVMVAYLKSTVGEVIEGLVVSVGITGEGDRRAYAIVKFCEDLRVSFNGSVI